MKKIRMNCTATLDENTMKKGGGIYFGKSKKIGADWPLLWPNPLQSGIFFSVTAAINTAFLHFPQTACRLLQINPFHS